MRWINVRLSSSPRFVVRNATENRAISRASNGNQDARVSGTIKNRVSLARLEMQYEDSHHGRGGKQKPKQGCSGPGNLLTFCAKTSTPEVPSVLNLE